LNGRVLATDNVGREFSFDILRRVNLGRGRFTRLVAAFQEGGIGSTVNLRTARRPITGASLWPAVWAQDNSETSKTTPTGSLLASYTTPDETFGILGSLVYDKRDQRAKRTTPSAGSSIRRP